MTEPIYSNRLAGETSPYLLQHAHNPVDWYPWGEEAFERARSEDKPIFLSIGYSACHWCHVMERESFENPMVAEVLNRHFVSIKVDREERPDVDSIYMHAVQMMTGHGGWPMSMFLTPEGVPFYGGTYFPPEERHGMPSFPRILEHVSNAYEQRRQEVTEVSEQLRAVLQRGAVPVVPGEVTLSSELLHRIATETGRNFDRQNGGFGGAPKFPPSMTLEFLAQAGLAAGDDRLRNMVEVTLQRMARGGIYDQIGGGFHRYSVDERWLVPHFEKMLYDNALLSRLYTHAWQWTKNPFYARIARETLGFITREMMAPEGGFYSSLDADSEGEEGKFFVWSRDEVIEVLGEEEGRIFCAMYDISKRGNWEETNIPNLPRDLDEVAADLGVSRTQMDDIASRARCRLFGRRAERVHPGRDEKILAGWNGWMLASFAEASLAFRTDEYLNVTRKSADFLSQQMMREGRLYRTYKDGAVRIPGLLEDYAGVAWGLIQAFEATQERRYLDTARSLADEILTRFADDSAGGFFDTAVDHEKLITRPKDLYDNATPAGNSVAAEIFFKLALYFGEARYREAAISAVATVLPMASKYGSAFGFLLSASGYEVGQPKEIVITGSAAESRNALLAVAGEEYVPHRILLASRQSDLPLLEDRPWDEVNAYVCRSYSCLAPTKNPEELRKLLRTF